MNELIMQYLTELKWPVIALILIGAVFFKFHDFTSKPDLALQKCYKLAGEWTIKEPYIFMDQNGVKVIAKTSSWIAGCQKYEGDTAELIGNDVSKHFLYSKDDNYEHEFAKADSHAKVRLVINWEGDVSRRDVITQEHENPPTVEPVPDINKTPELYAKIDLYKEYWLTRKPDCSAMKGRDPQEGYFTLHTKCRGYQKDQILTKPATLPP